MSRALFKEGDYVVYPVHGVGRLVGFEVYEVEGVKAELMVISFDRERMVLRLPQGKAKHAGLRPLSSKDDMMGALESLKQKAKVRRTMWSRRAQEYETKINSGDPRSIAEVIRDLYRSATQPDQSYSERQIYQAAIERFARELAAVEAIDENAAVVRVESFLKAA
ncbi:MAG: CarD family transcriptional regulator [Alphaproteobacteria bacterium]|nr:CarD family transcriptional regulator [Alphaproteobacteria bacterium]